VRPTFLTVAAVAALVALQAAGQPSHPRSGARGRPLPHPPSPVASQAAAGPSSGALFDASNLGMPVVLDRNWRVGITADPAAATPGFDDSSGSVREAKNSIADVPDESDREEESAPRKGGERPYAWFRMHIKLAPQHGPVALLIELPVSPSTSMDLGTGGTGAGVDVFANGRPIPPEGPHGPCAADRPSHAS